jgi:hypothetical protein
MIGSLDGLIVGWLDGQIVRWWMVGFGGGGWSKGQTVGWFDCWMVG